MNIKLQRRVLHGGIIVISFAIVLVFIAPKSKPTPSPTPSPTPDGPTMAINVVQYNIFGRPYEVSYDGQLERLAHIPALIHQSFPALDVITFAEADISAERNNLLDGFKSQGYPYATSVLADTDPFTSLVNGGVIIVSKWPIVREAQHIYRNACHYSDCLAAKGVKYARVNKTVAGQSKIFNLFATHMQAWSTPEGRDARIKQAQQLHTFMTELNIPSVEPVIFAGDFNTDHVAYRSQVIHLVHLLKASLPTITGPQQYTSDPRSNLLVGRDGAANSDKCIASYEQSWGPIIKNTYVPTDLLKPQCFAHNQRTTPRRLETEEGMVESAIFTPLSSTCYCSCCPLEWLDYILVAKAPYQQPVNAPTLTSVVLKTNASFVVDWTAPRRGMSLFLKDVSDHYPVTSTFVFPLDSDTPTIRLDGCTADRDCSFYAGYCYCTGAECFYNGTRVNGYTLGHTHPVNRNCLYGKTDWKCLCGPT